MARKHSKLPQKRISLPSPPKPGRPSKISSETQQWITRQITLGQVQDSVQVSKKLQNDLNIIAHPRTIRNSLYKAGLKAIDQPKKPNISKKNSAWVRDGNPLQPHQIKRTMKHGGGNIILWGCMTYNGVGGFCKIDGRMNQDVYKGILQSKLLPTIFNFQLDSKKKIFQHDNNTKHTAKSQKNWLSQQEFQVPECPASSPDLNPIKHLWAHLKKALGKYEKPPSGINELWERVQEEWGKISPDICQKLIESMPRRIEAVIQAKGLWTDY